MAANILRGPTAKPDYRGTPSVAFSIPPIAAVGLTEQAARDQNLKYRVEQERASSWYTAFQAQELVFGFKVLVEEATDRILGAHIVGPHASETINVFALAIRAGLTADQLKRAIFAYPTGASDISSMLP